MPTPERLAEQFEEHRPHVRAVAYRMLGSVSEAEDAVNRVVWFDRVQVALNRGARR